jgi:hypothetical protein
MNKLIVNGCTLVMTCGACPEQYDVFFEDFQIGYLRLRHGIFTASYLNYTGDRVYHGYPKGDGCFDDDERMFFLSEAVDSLIVTHNNKIVASYYDYVD